MFRVVAIILFICGIGHDTAQSIVTYSNARFTPMDPRYLLADLFAIMSESDCLCQCYKRSLCFVINYFAVNHSCRLYSAQLQQGQLNVMPVTYSATVYSLGNRSMHGESKIDDHTSIADKMVLINEKIFLSSV